MFPVRAYVVTPTFRPQRWGMGADELSSTQQGEVLAKAIKEASIKAAAASMAVQIGLLFVPVVGAAIAALISLVQFFTGKYYSKKIKQTIEDAGSAIQAYAKQSEARILATMTDIYAQEYKAAVELAVSNTPLEGLGDIWSRIGKEAHRAVDSKLAKTVSRIIAAPATIAVKIGRVSTSAILKGVAQVADKTGHDNFAAKVERFEEKGDRYAKMIQNITDPRYLGMLIEGREPYLVAQEQANALKNTAMREINTAAQEAIAKVDSPAGRAEIRKQTALTLRNDPSVQALRAQFEADARQGAQQTAKGTAALNNALTGSGLNKTTALVGTALAAGAAFLFMRQ